MPPRRREPVRALVRPRDAIVRVGAVVGAQREMGLVLEDRFLVLARFHQEIAQAAAFLRDEGRDQREGALHGQGFRRSVGRPEPLD